MHTCTLAGKKIHRLIQTCVCINIYVCSHIDKHARIYTSHIHTHIQTFTRQQLAEIIL